MQSFKAYVKLKSLKPISQKWVEFFYLFVSTPSPYDESVLDQAAGMTFPRVWETVGFQNMTLQGIAVELVKGLLNLASFAAINVEFVFAYCWGVAPPFSWIAMQFRLQLPLGVHKHTVKCFAFHLMKKIIREKFLRTYMDRSNINLSISSLFFPHEIVELPFSSCPCKTLWWDAEYNSFCFADPPW